MDTFNKPENFLACLFCCFQAGVYFSESFSASKGGLIECDRWLVLKYWYIWFHSIMYNIYFWYWSLCKILIIIYNESLYEVLYKDWREKSIVTSQMNFFFTKKRNSLNELQIFILFSIFNKTLCRKNREKFSFKVFRG